MELPVFFNCMNCPSYCCTYPRIPVTRRDVRRLARHFGLSVEEAERRYTKKGYGARERVLRHRRDEHFGSACRFLDQEDRTCTVHAARPAICRDHPGTARCGYYDFLMAERRLLKDPTHVATTNHP